jgi:hypothetical protein
MCERDLGLDDFNHLSMKRSLAHLYPSLTILGVSLPRCRQLLKLGITWKERERQQTNHSMAQDGGKPTFIVPKGLRRKQATTIIHKLLANPTS